MGRMMASRVWGNVAREIIAEHLMDGTSWAGPGCAMYAYAWAFGVSGCKHPGFDIAMPHGTPIYAARGGKVVQMRNPGQSGRMSVNIEDTLGERQEYVHFSRTDVSVGQVVNAGHRLGLSGTFNSPHLHFEHWRRNSSTSSGWSYLNPDAILFTEATAPPIQPDTGGTGLAAINGDFRKIGDVPASTYLAEFQRLGSPLAGQAETIRNAAVPMSALALAQMYMENKYSTTGIIIQVADNNPLAMRPWDADPRRNGNKPVLHWQTRAVVGQMNLPAHYAGAILDGSGNYFARFNTVADAVNEYKHRLQANSPYKNGVYNKARTLAEMLGIYAPAGDVHPVTGVANADSGYYNTVVTMLNRYAGMTGGIAGSVGSPGQPTPGGVVPSGQHKFILAMGHRIPASPSATSAPVVG